MELKNISEDEFFIFHMDQEGCCEGGYEILKSIRLWEFLD